MAVFSESQKAFGCHRIRCHDWKLPETPDEWREKVSPVITFPRLIAKSWSAFSKSRLPPKKPSHFQNAGAGFLAPKIAK
jgi:hypothetical protein